MKAIGPKTQLCPKQLPLTTDRHILFDKMQTRSVTFVSVSDRLALPSMEAQPSWQKCLMEMLKAERLMEDPLIAAAGLLRFCLFNETRTQFIFAPTKIHS